MNKKCVRHNTPITRGMQFVFTDGGCGPSLAEVPFGTTVTVAAIKNAGTDYEVLRVSANGISFRTDRTNLMFL